MYQANLSLHLPVVTISSYNPKYGVTLDQPAYLIRSGLNLTGVLDPRLLTYKPGGLILARDAHLQMLKSLHCSKLLLSSNKPHILRRLRVTSETEETLNIGLLLMSFMEMIGKDLQSPST